MAIRGYECHLRCRATTQELAIIARWVEPLCSPAFRGNSTTERQRAPCREAPPETAKYGRKHGPRAVCPLTREGRVARERQDVVEEKVERQTHARLSPEVEQYLGVERDAPAVAVGVEAQKGHRIDTNAVRRVGKLISYNSILDPVRACECSIGARCSRRQSRAGSSRQTSNWGDDI